MCRLLIPGCISRDIDVANKTRSATNIPCTTIIRSRYVEDIVGAVEPAHKDRRDPARAVVIAPVLCRRGSLHCRIKADTRTIAQKQFSVVNADRTIEMLVADCVGIDVNFQ